MENVCFSRTKIVQLFLSLLQSENQQIREDAISSLFELEVASEEIVKAMHDSNPKVRSYAVKAIGESKDIRFRRQLLDGLNDEDWSVRGNIVFALGKLRPRTSRKLLERALRFERHPFVLYAMAEVFGDWG